MMSPNFVLSLIGHIIAFRRISKCTKTPYPACPMRLYEPCTISRESAGGGLCSVPLPDMHIWLQQKGKMHLGVQSRKPFPLFFLFPRSADRTVRSGGGKHNGPHHRTRIRSCLRRFTSEWSRERYHSDSGLPSFLPSSIVSADVSVSHYTPRDSRRGLRRATHFSPLLSPSFWRTRHSRCIPG